ncbi:MAG TPA: hypothetical protein PLO34_10410, partial [Pseudoxanthomonas sp.]|nr:hypothetical protein [Pseudoxanthomonas sp.]
MMVMPIAMAWPGIDRSGRGARTVALGIDMEAKRTRWRGSCQALQRNIGGVFSLPEKQLPDPAPRARPRQRRPGAGPV